ncbi:hypothetical protein [Photobacterium damselae]|uniref:hypothetical protein n=1 Tax=Photobacterium damselae TaxID=38293 RepID=UPI001F240399|nr:hypothetical protein [Photobacterium damselae]UKA03860.1 hypothetical protein IHC89_15135 [Photobacterium damselae subsp. damselae]
MNINVSKSYWINYRDKLLPIMKQIERRNSHVFADETDKALSEGRAFLFVGEDGFFILEPLLRNEETIVNVMFAFNWGNNAIARYQETIERLSLDIGAKGLELCTAVKGLIPLLEQQRWEWVSTDNNVMYWIKRL